MARNDVALEEALESDHPLERIMDEIDTGREPGQSFNYAHAFMLETYSATMSILFDRFEDDELDEMERGLELIGASQTLEDWREVRGAFDALVERGLDRFDASERIDGSGELQPILKRSADQAADVEARLLDFAKRNWSRLTGA